jgi:hypothetical protein
MGQDVVEVSHESTQRTEPSPQAAVAIKEVTIRKSHTFKLYLLKIEDTAVQQQPSSAQL